MSTVHILLFLLVVVLIFGTKKLRNMGADIGGAVRDFKKGMDGGDEEARRADAERLRADPPAEHAPAARAEAKTVYDRKD